MAMQCGNGMQEAASIRTIAPRTPRVVELAGLAGAGKSTLLRHLEASAAGREPRLVVLHCNHLKRRFPHLLAWEALRLLPTALRMVARHRQVFGEELRQLSRLAILPAVLRSPSLRRAEVVVLDEGPVFILARLLALGRTTALGDPLLARRRQAAVDHWRGALDLIVWLDAPDEVLAGRIRQRSQPHLVKHAEDAAVVGFLRAFRTAFDRVLDALTVSRGVACLALDTHARPVSQLTDSLEAVLRQEQRQ
jgi:hypothetical protein